MFFREQAAFDSETMQPDQCEQERSSEKHWTQTARAWETGGGASPRDLAVGDRENLTNVEEGQRTPLAAAPIFTTRDHRKAGRTSQCEFAGSNP